MSVTIRDERAGDEAAIVELTRRAFRDQPHSDGSEPAIVERLRADGDLALSLVAEDASRAIIGHAAFSPVAIDGVADQWFGLGPVSVDPPRQREGIGSMLIEAGLDRLRQGGAGGAVVLGDPGYYGRFGFAHDPAVRYPGPPAKYFQIARFAGAPPRGEVRYAQAFV